MEFYEVIIIVVSITLALSAVSWVAVIQRAKNLISQGFAFRDEWDEALEDGRMSDAEKLALAQRGIAILENVLGLLQTAIDVHQIIKRKLRR